MTNNNKQGLFVLAYNNNVSVNSHKKHFLPRVNIENYKSKLIVEVFMISQLMTQLNNMMRLEKNQQDKVMIVLMVVC